MKGPPAAIVFKGIFSTPPMADYFDFANLIWNNFGVKAEWGWSGQAWEDPSRLEQMTSCRVSAAGKIAN
jgi:hypothetical protein